MNDDTKQWLEDVSQDDYIDLLKRGLKESKMTQSKFAQICGCSPSRISALLNKRYAEHTPKYIWEKARIYLKI